MTLREPDFKIKKEEQREKQNKTLNRNTGGYTSRKKETPQNYSRQLIKQTSKMETTEKPKREINQNPELLQYIRKCPVFNNNKTIRYEKKWECLSPTGGQKKTSHWNCF